MVRWYQCTTKAGVSVSPSGDKKARLSEAEDCYPLSFPQEAIWLEHELRGKGNLYNVPLVLHCRRQVSASALRAALADLVERHEILRTIYISPGGVPEQIVLRSSLVGDLLEEVALDAKSPVPCLEALEAYDFCLEAEPPVRAWLFHGGIEPGTVLLLLHHIAFDGGSLSLFLDELVNAYHARLKGRRPIWGAPALQYKVFAKWQRRTLSAEVLGTHIEFWRDELAPPLRVTKKQSELPAVPSSSSVTRSTARLTKGVVAALESLAKAEGLSFETIFRASLGLWLAAHKGQPYAIVAGFVDGRVDARLEQVIGMFVNTLPIRVSVVEGFTFMDTVKSVEAAERRAYTHQDAPYSEIVRAARSVRLVSGAELVDAALSVRVRTERELPEFDATVEFGEETAARFPLYQEVLVGTAAGAESTEIEISWVSDARWSDETLACTFEAYLTVLKECVEQPRRRRA